MQDWRSRHAEEKTIGAGDVVDEVTRRSCRNANAMIEADRQIDYISRIRNFLKSSSAERSSAVRARAYPRRDAARLEQTHCQRAQGCGAERQFSGIAFAADNAATNELVYAMRACLPRSEGVRRACRTRWCEGVEVALGRTRRTEATPAATDANRMRRRRSRGWSSSAAADRPVAREASSRIQGETEPAHHLWVRHEESSRTPSARRAVDVAHTPCAQREVGSLRTVSELRSGCRIRAERSPTATMAGSPRVQRTTALPYIRGQVAIW